MLTADQLCDEQIKFMRAPFEFQVHYQSRSLILQLSHQFINRLHVGQVLADLLCQFDEKHTLVNQRLYHGQLFLSVAPDREKLIERGVVPSDPAD